MSSEPRRPSAPADLARFLSTPGAKQLLRYAFAGLCVTQFAAAIYSALVLFLHVNPLQANLGSTLCGLCAGYGVHSRWSFAGGAAGREHAKLARFLCGALAAFFVNNAWVWLLVTTLHLPALSPVPLMVLVTPWMSFLLNRHWVFRSA